MATNLEKLAQELNSNDSLQAECIEHPLYMEVKNSTKLTTRDNAGYLMSGIPKQQVLVSGPNGKISIIRAGISMNSYEIYSIKGNLFEDALRFKGMGKCVESVRDILTCIIPNDFSGKDGD